MNRKALGLLIANCREERQLTQTDIADRMGWRTAQLVSNIERGTGKLPIAKIKAMADVLGLNPKTFAHLVHKVEAAEAAQRLARKMGTSL